MGIGGCDCRVASLLEVTGGGGHGWMWLQRRLRLALNDGGKRGIEYGTAIQNNI